MSMIQSDLLLGQEGGAGYVVERSLRFSSIDSAYLSKNFGSAGNRKTWTWAGWVKRSGLGTAEQNLFSCYTAQNNNENLQLTFNADAIVVNQWTGGYILYTSSVYRDVSAWYHIVLAVDTTQATASNRVKLYVNGTQVTAFSSTTYPAQNTDLAVNQAAQHEIGAWGYTSVINYFNGYLADVFFIDGQALDPSSFTEVSATTGQLIPKAYTGTYGTNGFHLPFSDNSTAAALGTDTSGNGNTWTVNNIATSQVTGSAIFNAPLNATPFADSTGNETITDTGSTTVSSAGTNSFNIVNASTYNNNGRWLTVSSMTIPSQYTIDYYYKLTSPSQVGNATVIDGGAETTFRDYGSGSSRTLRVRDGAGYNDYTYSVTDGVWYHVRITNSGIWVNGALLTGSPRNMAGRTAQYWVGTYNNSSSYQLAGQVGPVRILNVDLGAPPSGGLPTTSGELSNTATASTGANSDSLVDTPTSYGTDTGAGGEVRGNYATLNPLDKGSTVTLANGNLDASVTSPHNIAAGTVMVSSGKYYAEFVYSALEGGTSGLVGVCNPLASRTSYLGGTTGGVGYNPAGSKWVDGVNTGSLTTSAVGDVIGIALDKDNNQVSFYKNNALIFTQTGLNSAQPYTFAMGHNNSAGSFNFGQRPFAYTAPSGYKALCTTNLPDPVVAQPSTVMDVALYTGTGSSLTVSSLGFSPDLVWLKSRGAARNHRLTDTVRGATIALQSDLTSAEVTESNGLTAFNSNGFTVGSSYSVSSEAWVGWCWDAGSSTVTNTDGSITSSVRANPSAGFSIVTYTGTGVVDDTQTIGHGLNAAPAFVLCKRRDLAGDWWAGHVGAGWTKGAYLQVTDAFATSSKWWSNTAPTSSVVTLGQYPLTGAGSSYVAYCFAPVTGLSSFGVYQGNGSADGPFVYTGFRPKFIIWKASSAADNWVMTDSTRSPYNAVYDMLLPNSSTSESTYSNAYPWDYLSNGFKIRHTASNVSGTTYIYAAFAESPFQYARAR